MIIYCLFNKIPLYIRVFTGLLLHNFFITYLTINFFMHIDIDNLCGLQKNFKKPTHRLLKKSNNQQAKFGTNLPNPENFKFPNPLGPFYSDWLTSLHAQTTTKKQKIFTMFSLSYCWGQNSADIVYSVVPFSGSVLGCQKKKKTKFKIHFGSKINNL